MIGLFSPVAFVRLIFLMQQKSCGTIESLQMVRIHSSTQSRCFSGMPTTFLVLSSTPRSTVPPKALAMAANSSAISWRDGALTLAPMMVTSLYSKMESSPSFIWRNKSTVESDIPRFSFCNVNLQQLHRAVARRAGRGCPAGCGGRRR